MPIEISNPAGLHDPTGVERSFSNLRIALRSAGLDFGDVAQLHTHIVDNDAGKLAILGQRIAAIWGDGPLAQTLIGVAALALPGMRFEVDAIAVRSRELACTYRWGARSMAHRRR